MAPTQLFLSCVSAEFGSYRDDLRHNLDLPDVVVKIQEDFIAGGVPTLDKLDTYIRACDAVLHLVGDGLGFTAKPRSLDYLRRTYPDLTERFPVLHPFLEEKSTSLSYTQWEAWLALLHGKKLLICVPAAGVPRNEEFLLNEKQRTLQQAHLERLRGVEAYPEVQFLNLDQLTWKIQQALYRELRLPSDHLAKARTDWFWPQAWDFTTYRAEKREGFVGREWLFEEVRAWATDTQSKQALLIGADYGVGKSAFLAQLIETGAAGIPLAAEHFCSTEQADTLTAALFVRTLAAQFAEALPAYRRRLEADDAAELRRWLDEADKDPARAMEQAVLAPLAALDPSPEPQLLLVDALDEAQDPAAASRPNTPLTIVALLARYAKRLPPWLKLLATSRRRPDVIEILRRAFSLKEIDAEESRNLADLRSYALALCNRSPLQERLHQAQITPDEVAEFLGSEQQSSGKFLYVARVLNDLETGVLPLATRADLKAVPPGLDGFYAKAFELRFPNEQGYEQVEPILALLAEAREPLGRRELAAILGCPELEISCRLVPLRDFLRLRLRQREMEQEGITTQESLYSFDHLSLEQWLSEVDVKEGLPRAGRFSMDRKAASEQIRTWALDEVKAGRAHIWPYLVRHLGSHLADEERAEVIGGQLLQFPWLEARLRLAGLNALLGDFAPSCYEPQTLPPELGGLERSLRQASHVISHGQVWGGGEQLASQLLARLMDERELKSLLEQAREGLRKIGGPIPMFTSLAAQEGLLRVFPMFQVVSLLAVLPDGKLAFGSYDNTIRIWDPEIGHCTAVLKGHDGHVTSLAVMVDGSLASSSDDKTIRVWNPTTGECSLIIKAPSQVTRLLALRDGRMACAMSKSIRLWDPKNKTFSAGLKGHRGGILSLAVLENGRIASGSNDATIRLWDPDSGECVAVLEGHASVVWCLAVLHDGRIASGSSDSTIRLWDPASRSCVAVLTGHMSAVLSLVVLQDGRIASGSDDTTICLWDPSDGGWIGVFDEHAAAVNSLVVLADGCLASGSSDGTVRLWDLYSNPGFSFGHRHGSPVVSMAVMGDGQLATASNNDNILLWDPTSGQCASFLAGHTGRVGSLALLSDGHLASGSEDATIRLWDPESGNCTRILKGLLRSEVCSLVALCGGRFASGFNNKSVWIWDPALTNPLVATSDGFRSKVTLLAALGAEHLACVSLFDSRIHLINQNDGALVRILEGHREQVRSLVVLPDGRLASGSQDCTICLWDTSTPRPIAILKGHQSFVTSLVVLGNGCLASGSSDATIRLWDPTHPDGAPRVLFVADAAITALGWLPTHQLLVAGDASGRLHWLEMGHS